jgi:hypothetical protein
MKGFVCRIKKGFEKSVERYIGRTIRKLERYYVLSVRGKTI